MVVLAQPLQATQSTALSTKRKNKRRRISGLKRTGVRREPKQKFILFCEGKNTERFYFEAIKRLCKSTLIKVEIFGLGFVPYSVAERAVSHAEKEGLLRKSRRRKDLFERNDEVWAVFDRDNHPRFEEAIRLCEENGIKVGRSNPCFEVWLILHLQDYDKLLSSQQVQDFLGKLRPDYNKRGAKVMEFDRIVTQAVNAEQRAEQQLVRREQEGKKFGNPSTTVGRLTCAIRNADKHATID